MAINESQLEVWAKQGSVTQSRDTYAAIKNVLESSKAPYSSKSFSSFLQGSYGNDTNVYADSDVDIVLQLESTWYQDLSRLSEEQKAAYGGAFSDTTYGYSDFKASVADWLKRNYGTDAKPGTKAIFISANGSRRNADVLVAAQLRRYHKFVSSSNQHYDEGICFFLADGTRVENFPKQHSRNCTAKHQATDGWFKPTVRICKNMRNRMIDDGLIAQGLAPSYFLEGLLYNVPPENFGGTYEDTFVSCFNWIVQADKTKLVCANNLHWLARDGSHTSWPPADLAAFLDAAKQLWNDW